MTSRTNWRDVLAFRQLTGLLMSSACIDRAPAGGDWPLALEAPLRVTGVGVIIQRRLCGHRGLSWAVSRF